MIFPYKFNCIHALRKSQKIHLTKKKKSDKIVILFKESFLLFEKSSFIWIIVCEKQCLKHWWVSRLCNIVIHIDPDVLLIEITYVSLKVKGDCIDLSAESYWGLVHLQGTKIKSIVNMAVKSKDTKIVLNTCRLSSPRSYHNLSSNMWHDYIGTRWHFSF